MRSQRANLLMGCALAFYYDLAKDLLWWDVVSVRVTFPLTGWIELDVELRRSNSEIEVSARINIISLLLNRNGSTVDNLHGERRWIKTQLRVGDPVEKLAFCSQYKFTMLSRTLVTSGPTVKSINNIVQQKFYLLEFRLLSSIGLYESFFNSE